MTVLDISLDSNRASLLELLRHGAKVEYFDHHFCGAIPEDPNLNRSITKRNSQGLRKWNPMLRLRRQAERAIEPHETRSAPAGWFCAHFCRTGRNNGILIFLLLADHDVDLVADGGMHAKVEGAYPR